MATGYAAKTKGAYACSAQWVDHIKLIPNRLSAGGDCVAGDKVAFMGKPRICALCLRWAAQFAGGQLDSGVGERHSSDGDSGRFTRLCGCIGLAFGKRYRTPGAIHDRKFVRCNASTYPLATKGIKHYVFFDRSLGVINDRKCAFCSTLLAQ